MSFVKFYVCDPKLNTACKGRFGPSCGNKDYCYSTTRPECAKKHSNGDPIISAVIKSDSEEDDL